MATPSRHRWMEVEEIGGVTVVKFTRSSILDDEVIEPMGEQLLELAATLGRGRLLFNLANVNRLASSMVGKLLAVNKKVQAAGGRVALCRISPQFREVFDALRLTQVMPIYQEEQEALQSL